jgi:hypothetical protein
MNTNVIVLWPRYWTQIGWKYLRLEYGLMECWINEQRLTIHKSLIVLVRMYYEQYQRPVRHCRRRRN